MNKTVISMLLFVLNTGLAEAAELNVNGIIIRASADAVTAQLNNKLIWKKEAAQYYFPNTILRFKNYVMVAKLESGAFTTTRYDIFDAQKGFIISVGEKYLGELNGQLLFLEKEAPGLQEGVIPDTGLNIFTLKTQKVETTLLNISLNPKLKILDSCGMKTGSLFSFDNIRVMQKGKDFLVLAVISDTCQFQVVLSPKKSQLYVKSFKKIH